MTKLRNAVLAGVLTLGVGGAGALTAAPAFAAPVIASAAGGTMIDATGPIGQPLDISVGGPLWTFDEPVTRVNLAFTLPAGTRLLGFDGNPASSSTIRIDGIDYAISGNLGTGWASVSVTQPAPGAGFTSFTLPTIQVAQTTPHAFQGDISIGLVSVRTAVDDLLVTIPDDVPLSATYTWTDDMVSIPVIAPAIGGAAAIAGIGLAGIVLIRRRRTTTAPAVPKA